MGKEKVEMEKIWPKFQKKMGYTDKEMETWRSIPQYSEMVQNSENFMKSRIIAEVIEARACMAGHEVGQKIVMDGNGVLIREECPERMCIFLLGPLMTYAMTFLQTFKDNTDPNGIIWPRLRCIDLGVERGGWGLVLCKLYAEGPLADKFRSQKEGA